MIDRAQRNVARLVVALAVLVLGGAGAYAQTQSKPLDLDGNGVTESQADLVVNTSGPVVTIVNTVTNGSPNAFNFEWPSAGFGGLTSSVPAPIPPNVKRTVWTWTTTDPLVGYSGSTCATDLCFSKTGGPVPLPFRSCNRACLDGVQLGQIDKTAGSGQVTLNFTGGQAAYTVYRSSDPSRVTDATNALPVTTGPTYSDTPPSVPIVYYRVRGTGCLGPTTCSSNADCGLATEGFCTNVGPFGVPGRTKFGFSAPVTLSQGTLTSSLITFYSPGTEVFKATSTANAGGVVETLTNPGSTDVTLTIPAYPPECCPASGGPHQLKCGGTCVHYLSDGDNCGACGVVCAEDAYCADGSCEPICSEGQTLCGTQCVDTDSDVNHCGDCDTVCGETECCLGGHCTPPCAPGLTLCGNECFDLANDSAHCGTCDSTCGTGSCCVGGACTELSCDTEGGGWSLCGTQCVRLGDDDGHCGSCDNACNGEQCCDGEGSCVNPCSEGETVCAGECVNTSFDDDNCGACGQRCDDGTCCVSGSCVPLSCGAGSTTLCGDVCTVTDRDPTHCGDCDTQCAPGACCNHGSCQDGGCGPQVAPSVGTCPNQTPYPPGPTACQAQPPPFDATCLSPNPNPAAEPSQCATALRRAPAPTSHRGTLPDEAPVCMTEEVTQVIPAQGDLSLPCKRGGPLFREVPSSILVCGDEIPGVTGECRNGTTGTFNRLVADPTLDAGHAYVTPVAVHVLSDTSNDGLIQPGETATLKVDVLNAGDMDILDAHGTLAGPAVDLTDDDAANPKGVAVSGGPASYATIPGLPTPTECVTPLRVATTPTSAFTITVPADHPGDTSRPMILSMTGRVNGDPQWGMDVPFSLGIGSSCNPAAHTRSYDGITGLANPMAKLVPEGDPVPFPSRSFTAGNTRPLKLNVLCGSVNLDDAAIDPPEITGLSEATRGALDIRTLNLNSENGSNPNDPFFRFDSTLSAGGQWIYNMKTALIGTGSFTLRIKIAGRKEYVTGFALR